jgi:SAM-dependent methyltransferase
VDAAAAECERIHASGYCVLTDLTDSLWRVAGGYTGRAGPALRHAGDRLLALLSPYQYESILQVDCGGGELLVPLARHFRPKRVVGMDPSPAALKEADRNVFGEFRCVDVAAAPLAAGETFDLVLCLSLATSHDPDTLVRNLLPAVGRHLVLASFPRARADNGTPRRHPHADVVAAVARGAGLQVMRTVRWGWPFYAPLFLGAEDAVHRIGTGRLPTVARRAVGAALYHLYRLNAADRGDVVYVLAARRA